MAYCKYYKKQKYVSYDSGTTWEALNEYAPGELYERNSHDCPSSDYYYRWYNVENGYMCEGHNLYKKQIYQYSTDGVNYTNVYPTTFRTYGQPVEVDSEYCNNKFEGHYYTDLINVEPYTPPPTPPPTPTPPPVHVCNKWYVWNDYLKRCIYIDPIRIVKCQSNSDTLSSGDTKYHVDTYSKIITEDGEMYKYTYKYILGKAIIGDCVTTIGDRAFRNCSGLTSVGLVGSNVDVEIPNSVTTIGKDAFQGCSGITDVTIGNSVRLIDDSAFSYCVSLSSCTIGSGVTSISDSVFRNCIGLTSIDIPDSVTTIGNSAFYNCSGLTSVNIPSSVTSIGASAFTSCNTLTSIDIPDSVTTIGDFTLAGCSGLTSVTIGSGITSIGRNVFDGCSSLTDITIPNSVTSIGWAAFKDCSGLVSINLSDSITSIGSYAFSGCTGLSSITVNATTPPTIGTDTFGNTNNCTIYVPCDSFSAYTSSYMWSTYANRIRPLQPCSSYKFDATYSDSTRYMLACDISSTLSSGQTKNHTTSYTAMTRAYIGDCVNTIGNAAFSGCSSLSSCTISSGVTSIGDRAFTNCRSLTGISIPSGVTTIGERAFYNCSGLTSVNMPSSVTSISNNLFYGCSSLTSVNIPSDVSSIGNSAFYNCSGLTSVNMPSGVTSISNNLFYGCSSLSSITIPSGVTSIGYQTFSGCTSLSSITIPSSVTSIDNYALAGCIGLTSITINAITPPSLSGGADVFINTNNCPIYVPCDSVIAYKSAYRWTTYANRIQGIPPCTSKKLKASYSGSTMHIIDCNSSATLTQNEVRNYSTSYSAMTGAEIGDCVTIIDSSAFTECIMLKTVYIPNSVTTIGYRTFRYCSGLTSIELPDSITTIGGQSFYHCSGLTSITINAITPPSIGTSAFGDTNNCPIYVPLESVDIYKADSSWGSYASRIQAIP